VIKLLGVSAWYQRLLKGAIILLGAADVGRREVVPRPVLAPDGVTRSDRDGDERSQGKGGTLRRSLSDQVQLSAL
jgi:hypothetical protein